MSIFATFANQKGGVGKTTSSTNAAVGIAQASGKPVLLVDTDSSGNATLLTTGHTDYPRERSLSAVLTAKRQDAPALLQACIVQSTWHDKLHVLPSNHFTQQAEQTLAGKPGAPFVLKRALQSVSQHYAAVVFDTQPSFSLLTVMALLASNLVYVPIEPRYLETAGLNQILGSITEIREGWDHQRLRMGGILITKLDGRVRGHREMLETLHAHPRLGPIIVGTIPVNEAIAYSHHQHTSIFNYDPRSNAARAYAQLVNTMIGGR